MTLEERYNAAGADTYVGKVRSKQAADAGAIDGSNFMNGEGFVGTPPAPDQVQTEFKRNAAGDFRYGGGSKIPAATNNKSYPLSRWLAKGVDKADSYLVDKFKQLNDVRNGNKAIHQYDWRTAGNSFAGKSATAKSRIDGSPAGRAPGGING
jgi:hypothetical protein